MSESQPTARESLQWYFDQAAAGDPLAKRELGRMYLHGFTHDEDPSVEILPDGEQADRWLTEATEEGDDEAAWLLGILYDGEASNGAYDEPEKSFQLYQRAVDRGCRPARFYLATRYLIGRGVKRNDERGRELLLEAAYGGDTSAQSFMSAVCDRHGDAEGSAAWKVVASLFADDDDEEQGDSMVGEPLPAGTLERARLMIQRVNIYSALLECDDPSLIRAADLLRETFQQEAASM